MFWEQGQRLGADNVRTVTLAWAEHLFVVATAGCTPYFPLSNLYMSKATHDSVELLSVISRTAADLLCRTFDCVTFSLRLSASPHKFCSKQLRRSYLQNSNSSREEKRAEIN